MHENFIAKSGIPIGAAAFFDAGPQLRRLMPERL
jgi:hypothetical protein